MSKYPYNLVEVYPKFDQPTVSTHAWGRATHKAIESYYENIATFDGRNATRNNLEDALDLSTDIYLHWDHGGRDTQGGYDKEHILDLDNVNLLEGMHCYSYSCLSASKLGPTAVKKAGAYSYVGYRLPAFVCPLANPFYKRQAMYYPVELTKRLENLNLVYPDPEQEIEIAKKTFRDSKEYGYKMAFLALITIYGAIFLSYNMLHYTLCLPPELKEEEEISDNMSLGIEDLLNYYVSEESIT